MAYVKTAIATIFVLIGLLIGYMFIAFDSGYELKLAYDSFLKGQNEDAQRELVKVKDSIPQDQRDLYEAYVARALKQMNESQTQLDQAATIAKGDLLLEVRLNQALNAYLMHDPAKLKEAVEEATKLGPQQPWVIFFQALEHFEAGDYTKALELWSVRSERTALSGWMKKAFDGVFTRPWMTLTLSRCQIEAGKYLLARQTLEEEMEGAPEAEQTDINFLLGLSYAKEAHEKTAVGAAPYWKLAFSYFTKVPMQNERYNADRQQLVTSIEKVVNQLFDARTYQDLPFYASVLQAWGADAALNDMASTVITHLNQALTDNQWRRVEELAVLLNRILPDGDNRQKLQRRFRAMATTALSGAKLEQVTEYWAVAHLLSNNPDQMASDFASKTAAKIVALIPVDDASLSQTKPYIKFWADIDKKPEARLAFAKNLLTTAEQVWISPGGEKKAQQVIDVTLELVPKEGQEALRGAIQKMITNVYEEANKRDDVDKFPSIMAAAERYHVTNLDMKSDTQLRKHVTAAQELLKQGRYDDALHRGLWVLQLSPTDQQARYVVGVILYEKADYAQAKQYLASLSNPTPAVREALAVSQILTGDVATGVQGLDQVKAKRALQDDTLLRIGLGLLIRGKPNEALMWLKQIKQPSPEVTVASAYADFLLKRYEKVVPALRDLSTPYSALDGVRGLAIQTDVILGHHDAAEKALIKLLRQPEQPSTSGMSAAFQQFDKQKLSEFGRYFLAGLFFKDVRQKNDVAIKYFRLIKDPTPTMLVVRGETLEALNQHDEAIADLTVAANQEIDPVAREQAMPLLAIALDGRQRILEAYTWFKRYFELQPKTKDYRSEYAHLLQKLKRFDLALEQYAMLGPWDKLEPLDMIGFALSQFNLGHPNDAIQIGDQFLTHSPPYPLAQQLMMSRLMARADNLKSTWPILKALPPNAKLSTDEAIQLLHFLIEIGAYNQAVSIVTDKLADLEKTIEGLSVLAELAQRLGRNEAAIAYVKAAKKLDPGNLDLATLLGKYTQTVEGKEAIVTDLDHRTDQEPDNISLRVVLLQQLAWLGDLARSTDKHGSDRYISNFQTGTFWIEKNAGPYGEMPQVRCVMGELLNLLNKPREAILAYRAALSLDPSYVEAAVHLADAYVAEKDLKSAQRMLFQATQYQPDNAEAWHKLAALYSDDGNLYEASHYYQNAIKFQPNNLELYLTLGKVFLEVRNPEDAKVLLEHAVSIDPKNVKALGLLLECLHDPLLGGSSDDPKALAKQQQQVYQKLHTLDPKLAEKLMTTFAPASEEEELLSPAEEHHKSYGPGSSESSRRGRQTSDLNKYFEAPEEGKLNGRYHSDRPAQEGSGVESKYFEEIPEGGH